MADTRIVRTTRLEATPKARIAEIHFTRPGTVTVGASPAKRPASNFTMTGLSVSLTTGGDGPTTVEVHKNGEVVASVTLNAGGQYNWTDGLNIRFIARVDVYQIVITEVGDGAIDLGGSIECAA